MRFGSLLLLIAGVAGCATSRDIRTLQMQIDELRTQQNQVAGRLARIDSLSNNELGETRKLVADAKFSLNDITTRLDQIEARMAEFEQPSSRRESNPPQGQMPPYPGDSVRSDFPMDVQAVYAQAFDALRREDYSSAITGFREYLRYAPSAADAGSAVYWIGESFHALKQHDSALAQFQAVVDRYTESDKVPAALLKIGNIYEARGDKKSAFPYYRRLKEEFPQSLEYQQLRKKLGE
jgi:tol-pal system protein YbgF